MDLRERYGAPSPVRRRAVIAGSVILAVVFLAWVGWAAVVNSDADVRSAMVTRTIEGEHAATARIDVHLADADTVATCVVRAIAEDHTVVGEVAFDVRAGDLDAAGEIEVTVRTERRATSIDLVGCTTEGQSRPQ